MSTRNIDAYVDAVRGYRALMQAVKDEGLTPTRHTAIVLAKQDVRLAYAKLTGRETWLAGRALAVNPNTNGGN